MGKSDNSAALAQVDASAKQRQWCFNRHQCLIYPVFLPSSLANCWTWCRPCWCLGTLSEAAANLTLAAHCCPLNFPPPSFPSVRQCAPPVKPVVAIRDPYPVCHCSRGPTTEFEGTEWFWGRLETEFEGTEQLFWGDNKWFGIWGDKTIVCGGL